MAKLFKMTLIATLLLQGFTAQAGCHDLLRKILRRKSSLRNAPEYSYMEKVSRIERMTNFLRKLTDNPEPSLNIKIWKKIDVLNDFIFAGSHAPNERQWRVFFREFEANYISFVRSNDVVDIILKNSDDINADKLATLLRKKNYPEAYIDFITRRSHEYKSFHEFRMALELEKKNTLTHLGSDYQEYRLVRGHLEDLKDSPECTEICQTQVERLLGGLGVESDKEKLMFEVFFKGEGRPPIDEMRELLYAEPLFVLTRLKKERNAEIFSLLRGLIQQPEFLDSLFGFIYKSKLLGKRRAVKLFQFIYNAHAKNNHFPKINRVLNGAKEPQKLLELLQNVNTTVDRDELLVTFSRRIDPLAQKKWQSILEKAKELEPDFAKRMLDATEKGKARGDLSPSLKRSFAGRVALIGLIAVPAVGYFYFDGLPSSIQEIITSEEITEVDPDAPLPDEGEQIPFDGEEDLMLEEVGEVLTDNETTRDPSSKKQATFTRFWCSLMDCSF